MAKLEALLFVSGEPLTRQTLLTLLELNEADLQLAISSLRDRYLNDATMGISLLEHDGQYELATKPVYAALIESFTKSFLEEHLSKAALEVLAIIAYRGPITRVSIETIRGVNCNFTIRNLLLRGLIERAENPEDAREYVYTASMALLEKLGITQKQELPNFETLSQDPRLKQVLTEVPATQTSETHMPSSPLTSTS